MKTVIVASTNPVKINAAREAFEAMFTDEAFDFIGFQADSKIPEQPIGSDQTLEGAQNRLRHVREAHPRADFWIAFEGGVEETGTTDAPRMTSVIWVVVTDISGYVSPARCVTFQIPPPIADLIRGGMSLGDADDRVFNRTNSKQQNGSIGIVTHDVLTRTSVYRDGAVMALVPFRNRELYAPLGQRKAS